MKSNKSPNSEPFTCDSMEMKDNAVIIARVISYCKLFVLHNSFFGGTALELLGFSDIIAF